MRERFLLFCFFWMFFSVPYFDVQIHIFVQRKLEFQQFRYYFADVALSSQKTSYGLVKALFFHTFYLSLNTINRVMCA